MNRFTIPISAILIALFLGFAGCGGGGGSSTASDTYRSNAEDIALLEQSIVLENEAYSQLLAIFSGNGDYQLFDERIDLNETTLVTIGVLTKQLAEAYKGYDTFYESMAKKYPADTTATPTRAIELRAPNIFAKLIKTTTGYDAGRENMRTFMSKVLNSETTEQKQKVYDQVKAWATQGNRNIDIGDNYSLFYEKLNEGELDDSVYEIHNDLYNTSDGGIDDYIQKSKDAGASPSGLCWTIGVDAVNKAVEFEMKAYAAATGPLGAAVSKTIDAINTIETVRKDPIAGVKKIVNNKMADVLKTNLSKVVNTTGNYAKFHNYINDTISTEGANLIVNNVENNVKNFARRVETNKKLVNNNYDAKAVMTEMQSEQSAGDVDWNVGGIVQSVADGAANAGSMIMSYYNQLTQRYENLYNQDTTTDEAITLLSSDNNYSMVVFDDKNETKPTELVQNDELNVTKDQLSIVDADMQTVGTTPSIAITRSQDPIYVDDEVTLSIKIPQTMYPPFSLSYSGSSSAIFVLSANLSTRESAFADFTASSKGTYSYTITVTDKYGNTMSQSISLDVIEKTVNPPQAVSYTGSITATITGNDNCIPAGTYPNSLAIAIDSSNNVTAVLTIQTYVATFTGIQVSNSTLVDDGSDSVTWSGTISGTTISGTYHDSTDNCNGTFTATQN